MKIERNAGGAVAWAVDDERPTDNSDYKKSQNNFPRTKMTRVKEDRTLVLWRISGSRSVSYE
jgi:hypothetical protein